MSYARNPTFNININCNTDTEFRDVHTIITAFLDRTRSKEKQFMREKGNRVRRRHGKIV